MATQQQLETIANRMFPGVRPDVTLSHSNRFLARVMSAGDDKECAVVQDHFGKAAMRAALNLPPEKVFDRPSWNLWHRVFGLQPPEMPQGFFTVYPWFENRGKARTRPTTAEDINHVPDFRGPVWSCDELRVR